MNFNQATVDLPLLSVLNVRLRVCAAQTDCSAADTRDPAQISTYQHGRAVKNQCGPLTF